MPINTDLTSPIGEIRVLIGDTIEGEGVKPGGGNFSDDELAYFLAQGGSVRIGAALACESLAWQWNVHPDFAADGLQVKRNQVAQGWWRAALRFRQQSGATSQTVTRRDAYSEDNPDAA